jgi:hypothetical protein
VVGIGSTFHDSNVLFELLCLELRAFLTIVHWRVALTDGDLEEVRWTGMTGGGSPVATAEISAIATDGIAYGRTSLLVGHTGLASGLRLECMVGVNQTEVRAAWTLRPEDLGVHWSHDLDFGVGP